MSAHATLKLNRPKATIYHELAEIGEQTAPNACPPLSDYRVGASALLWDGRVYIGCNTENPNLDLTIHGEMSAVNAAISDGALEEAKAAGLDQFTFVKAVSIMPERMFDGWPCGHCREFLSGFGLTMDMVVRRQDGGVDWKPLSRLYPHAPGAERLIDLTREGKLLDLLTPAPQVGVKMGTITSGSKTTKYRQLLEFARGAAGFAYSPYSKRPAGAAVLLSDGSVYTAARAENVGYTVSSAPEQAAVYSAISDGALHRHIEAGGNPQNFVRAIASVPLGQPDTWPTASTRQCLCDFGLGLDIVVEDQAGEPAWKTLGKLFPHAFVPDVLSYWTGS